MKKVFPAVLISLVLALAMTASGLAALPGTGWWTAYRVQNIADTTGTITMQAYDQGVTAPVGSSSFDFGSGEALVYNPGLTPDYPTGNLIGFTSELPSGFVGSVVLSSSVPAASVVELANYTNGTLGGGGTASSMYQGISGEKAATTLLAPTIKHAYGNPAQTTTLYVQAAGADASATITYTMNDTSTHTQTTTISANRMFIFDPANATPPVASTSCGTDANTSPCYGSAIVTSTSGNIVGVVVEHPHTGSPAAYVLSSRLATPSDQSTKIYAPSIKNDYATGTGTGIAGMSVLNVGTGTAQVQITLTVTQLGTNASGVNVGDVFINTVEIPAGTSYLFSKYNNNLGGLPAGTFAAAVIESLDDATHDPQPLVGTGNDSKTLSAIPGGKGKTQYNAFPSTVATDHAASPNVKEYIGVRRGGVTAQNVGTSADTIYFEYYEYGTDNVYVFWTTSPVAVGAAVGTNSVSTTGATKFSNDGTWTFSELSGKEFSVIVYTSGGQPIIVLNGEQTTDSAFDMSNYEGVNY